MLESRILAVTLLAAAANAGVIPSYPITPLAKITSPLPAAAPRLAYAAPAYTKVAATPVAYAAPTTYAKVAAAPIAYAAPAAYAKVAAPIAYAPQQAHYAAPIAYAQAPVAKAVVPAAVDTDYDPNPSYSYAYDIQDVITGDSKSQQESRQGDTVQGSYTLIEPDGTRRTVEYTADPVNGFNAVVHREPAVQKAIVTAPVAKVAAPVAYAKYAPAPLAYASPVAKTLAIPSYH